MKYLTSLFALLLVSVSSANAANPIRTLTEQVVSSTSHCTVTKTASNSWKGSFSLEWLTERQLLPWGGRVGRGLLIYLYDSRGNIINSVLPARDITMNGAAANDSGIYSSGNGYLAYGYSSNAGWNNYDPHSTNVSFNVNRTDVAIVAMYPANVYGTAIYIDNAGAVSFSPSQVTSSCQIITNPNTPPSIVNLTMNAPDWALGEIGAGKQQKVLTNSADRLCINYLSTESKSKDFIVNATNANGKVNNRYVLKHSLKPTNTLPYTLTLDNTGKKLLLPNSNNSTVKFDSSGNQICFTPTFDLYGSDNQEPGDYSDVITYEIVTKS